MKAVYPTGTFFAAECGDQSGGWTFGPEQAFRQQLLEIAPAAAGFEVRLLRFVGRVSTGTDGVEEGGRGVVAGRSPCGAGSSDQPIRRKSPFGRRDAQARVGAES
jgi:hypothetical protein